MKGKWLLIAGVAAILAVGGWAVWRLWPAPPVATKAPEQKDASAEPETNPDEINLSGRVQAQKMVVAGAPVDGTLENLSVREGEEVGEGQLLARVKNDQLDKEQEQQQQEVERLQSKVTNLEAQLAGQRLEEQRTKAEAEESRLAFERARKAFDRQAMLYKEGATARLTYERAQKEFTNSQVEYDARASLARQASERLSALNKSLEDTRKALVEQTTEWEESKNDLNATEIHSPAAGIIIKVNKQNGDAVTSADKEIFHVAVDLTAMEVIVEFAPAEVQRVKPGMKAVITLVEAGSAPIEGVLREIRETTGYIEFSSPSETIVPGLIAQVKILLKQMAPAEAAPVESKKKKN